MGNQTSSKQSTTNNVGDQSSSKGSLPREGFKYEKGVCALSWWLPVKLLEEGSISDIHLCRRRPKPIKVRYKEKRDVMNFAKSHSDKGVAKKKNYSSVDCCGESLFVLKSIHKDHIGNERVLDEMRREIFTMSHLNHPNIVKLYEAYERRRHVYLVLEYCSGGNLAGRRFSENECAPIVQNILDAVAYMHSQGVVHRDLKLENLMLDRHGEIKIIDFGLATKFLSEEFKTMTDKVGTLYSMAPQVLQGVYTFKCDLWSIGVVTYLLLSGQQPFWGPPRSMPWAKRRKVMIDRIMRCRYTSMTGPKWEGISQQAKDFTKSLLQMDPDDRPTAAEALEDPWIQGHAEAEVVHVALDEQFELRASFKRKVWDLLSSKLREDEILSLRQVLEEQDTSGQDLVRMDDLRKILQDQTSLQDEDVDALFADERLDTTASMDHVDLMVEVLTGKYRNTVDSLAKALDDMDVEGTRKVNKSELEPMLKQHNISQTDLWGSVETDDNGCVSTVRVLEVVGKKAAKQCRDSIRSSNHGNEQEDDSLINENNAMIPGGRVADGEGHGYKYIYSTEHKSMEKV